MNIFNVNKTLKGIALILFGILLCICSGEINNTVLHGFRHGKRLLPYMALWW